MTTTTDVSYEVRYEVPYEVYGRGRQDPALWHLGMVRAVSVEDAEVFAYMTFDEQKWVEMVIVPRSAVVDVVSPQ
ncbi:MAG TPA: hypothetical protein VK053_03975 [Jiangellaceae bacterium]|nr:hypothetical protein [Jiangellaceae bacterium]